MMLRLCGCTGAVWSPLERLVPGSAFWSVVTPVPVFGSEAIPGIVHLVNITAVCEPNWALRKPPQQPRTGSRASSTTF